MDDDFELFLIVSIVIFVGFTICTFGIVCCAYFYRKRNQAVYSSPVMITGQSYQPPGSQQPTYTTTVQTTHQLEAQNQPMTHIQNPQMPYNIQTQMPMPQSTPYNPHQQAQMPMPYQSDPQPAQFAPQTNQLPYPAHDASIIPQAGFSNDSQQGYNDGRNDDPPPSYHKIDKL